MDQPHTAKTYLSKAVAAEKQAELCCAHIAKTAWQDVPKQYRHLAAFAERNLSS